MRMLIGLTLLLSGCADVGNEHQLIREHLALSAGMNIADVGAGDGDYSAWFAGEVGNGGAVFATELGADAVAELAARFADTPNVTVVAASPDATGLPEACCDVVFLRNVYHHLSDPTATLQDMRRALKPGATLFVIDFEPAWILSLWTSEHHSEENSGHGATPEQIAATAGAAGFRHEATLDWPDQLFIEQFAVKLRNPG